jgi:uncharacterized protein (TIGR03663 family)
MILERTFHPDEANQALTTGRLLESGMYVYNPRDHHGPTLYYAAAPVQKALGVANTAELNATALRCTPLIFAALALVFAFRLTRNCKAVFALATAPIFFFFATFFIQEMMLAAFLLGAMFFLFSPSKRSPFWLGVFTALAFATKETALISFAAASLAWLAAGEKFPRRFSVTLATAAATCVLFFTDFCRDFSGLREAFITMPGAYLNRAAGDATSTGAAWHIHPWWQYLKWIFASGWRFSELPALMVSLAALAKIIRRPRAEIRLPLFLAVYTALSLLIYSAIPYKTPWCALQITVPLLLLTVVACGHAAKAAYGWLRPVFAAAPIAIALLHIPSLIFINSNPDSKLIPYNYASASPQVKAMADCIKQAGGEFVAVALPPENTWPLPFYLRDIKDKTGYWTTFEELEILAALKRQPDVVVVPAEEGHRVQPLFPHLKNTRRFEMRNRVRIRVFW